MKGRTQKAENTRQKIIEAAVDFFYEYGYEKASLRNIADQVGLTKAAVYHHFQSKEQILYTIIETYSDELIVVLKSSVSETRDPVEALRNAILQQLSLIKLRRKGVKIIIEDKRFLSEGLQSLVRDKEKIVYHFYKDLLVQIQKAGRLKDADLMVTTFGILGQITWVYHWYRPNRSLTLEELADNLTRLLLRGLLKEKV